MKRLFFAGIFLLLFQGTVLAEIRPPAEPVSALFYPNEVEVVVEERLTAQSLPTGKGFVLSLPGRSIPESFSVAVNSSPVSYSLLRKEEAIAYLQKNIGPAELSRPATKPEQEHDPKRKALLQPITDITLEVEKYTIDISAAEGRLSMWESAAPAEMQLKPADMLALDKALTDTLPALIAAKSRSERLLKDASERLEEAEEALAAYDDGQAPEASLVVIVPYDKEEKTPCVVTYSYILPGSYKPSYTINALPEKGHLEIEQNATLYQSSGLTWKNVAISISTTGRDTALQPFPLSPWTVRLNAPELAKRMVAQAPEVQMSMAAVTADFAAEQSTVLAPRQEEKGTFRLWKIGKHTMENDLPLTVSMTKDTYDAAFFYTIRPEQSSKGFLTAELHLKTPLELPIGNARFFVDGSLTGQRNISINGNKAVLYFGTDPQIVGTRTRVAQTTGEQGFISKEQSLLWHWEITVRNARSRAVDVRVEEARPDVQDTAVTVTATSTPKPEEIILAPREGGSKAYLWKLHLKPDTTETISYKVQIVAPQDKNLSPGRYN